MTMLLQIDRPPTPNHLFYLQADFIEFSCLIHPDKVIDYGQVLTLYSADADINRENEYGNLSSNVPDNSDSQALRIYEWFQYLKQREHGFGGAYPFYLNSESISMQLKSVLNDHQKLYLYLLLASSLRHFEKAKSNLLSGFFEAIAAEALRQYIGDRAEVRIFGKGSFSHYSGNKYSKLQQLGNDICEPLRVSENRFPPTDTADAGLDIVAWFPIHDTGRGRLLVFGQCACGQKWEDKQFSSGYDKWNGIFDLSVYPVNAIMIPHCFRDASGDWYANDEIHMTLMFDRVRIMRLLETVELPLANMPHDVSELMDLAIDNSVRNSD